MIKFIKPAAPIGWAYKDGQTANLTKAAEESIVEAGFAVFVNDPEAIEKAVSKPVFEKAVKKGK